MIAPIQVLRKAVRVISEIVRPTDNKRASTALIRDANVIALRVCGTPERGSRRKFINK